MHISALGEDLTRVFGLSPVEFREQFGSPDASPPLIAGVRHDLNVMRGLSTKSREKVLNPDKSAVVKRWLVPFRFRSRDSPT